MVSVVISLLSFLILFIWVLSLFFLMNLVKGLSILFIFSKNQLLVYWFITILTIFPMLYFTSLWVHGNYQFVLLNPFASFTQSLSPLPALWPPPPVSSLRLSLEQPFPDFPVPAISAILPRQSIIKFCFVVLISLTLDNMLKSLFLDSYCPYCPQVSTKSLIYCCFNFSVHYLCNFKYLNLHLCFNIFFLGKTFFIYRKPDYLL